MSNLKFVAGTVKRRGIAIAAAVAVAGGSLATANYAMAVEVSEPSFDELHNEFFGTEAGNVAVDTVNEAATALKNGATDDEVRQILQNGLKSAAGVPGSDFSEQELGEYPSDELQSQLQETVASAKQTLATKKGASGDEQPAAPAVPAPQAPAQNPADWATPAPAGKYSPQRLEAEFGGTWKGQIADVAAKNVAKAIREGKSDAEIKEILRNGFKAAGFTDEEISSIKDEELNKFVGEAKAKTQKTLVELNHTRQDALQELNHLSNLNPLQRAVFYKQIESADNSDTVNTVLAAAKAENANPVAPFAPAPGEQTPVETPDTDVEKALDYTKAEALEKLRALTHLTEQQKAEYEKQVNAATQVFEVEDAYEAGVAKDKVNEEAKKASGFLAKAIARTKHLALEKLDGFTNLTHEQKKEARNKILAAKQVFEVEAAFHAAEKLNKAAK
ncbi:GA module-containing protein [Corynebacterium propinquum]